MGQHEKRFTGIPRQLLERQRVYLIAWVGNRWEVVAESQPLADGPPAGPPCAPESRASGAEVFGVAWRPITPEEIRDRARGFSPLEQ